MIFCFYLLQSWLPVESTMTLKCGNLLKNIQTLMSVKLKRFAQLLISLFHFESTLSSFIAKLWIFIVCINYLCFKLHSNEQIISTLKFSSLFFFFYLPEFYILFTKKNANCKHQFLAILNTSQRCNSESDVVDQYWLSISQAFKRRIWLQLK